MNFLSLRRPRTARTAGAVHTATSHVPRVPSLAGSNVSSRSDTTERQQWHSQTRPKSLKEASVNKIALLNDNFRVTFLGGQVVMTAGVNELPLDVKALALVKTQRFKDFTEDNDPPAA